VAGDPAAASVAEQPPPAKEPPLRVVFVGQSVYFAQCALEAPAAGLEPSFIDFRAGVPPDAMLAAVAERNPDVVVVFRPEIIPTGAFADLRALTIGYLTEPLPRTGQTVHKDLEGRMWWMRKIDPSNFDRIVSFDPLIADTAQTVVPVWRSEPIPVADSLYMDVRERPQPPGLLFVGRATEHRERLLEPVKRAHAIVHIGHGIFGEQLLRFFARSDIQLNLHNNPYPTFENRICLALAAGHLVISEPLSPSHDLIDREHFLQASTPEQFLALVDEAVADPLAFADVQAAGHAQAERFRASVVYPRLIAEAIEDVAMHGSPRQAADGRAAGAAR
jgi:hypothetical protein